MFTTTKPMYKALRRLALTTKQVNGGYYKGNRTGSMGRHTKHGGYIVEWRKVRTYVAPANLTQCKLTPFVTKTKSQPHGKFEGYTKGPLDGNRYLDLWKMKNGQD